VAKAYIGTSGWNYRHWSNGEFYPENLRSAEWLGFFVRHFCTVEINSSFYRLPSEIAFQNWRIQVPPGFIFSVKASRFLTHIKRLKDPEAPLHLFFSRAKRLKEKLGPVLFQLPPQFKLNLERLEAFLKALKPYIRRQHIRCVIEFRDSSWQVPAVFELLREYGVALCFADWRDAHVTGPLTADFVYVRRHYGDAGGGNYSRQQLDRDVEQILCWLQDERDVYVYFNNDAGGHAIRNAAYVEAALISAGTGTRKRAADSTTRPDFARRSGSTR
jgi:uncharacterized protein YecE (DUF72 family)